MTENSRGTHKLLMIVGLIITLILGGTLNARVEAQGNGVRLRQPFEGTYRLTAYVDHHSPDYTADDVVVVYNGEKRRNCPDCGETWTTQGPYCYHGHDGTDYALPCGTSVLAAAAGTVSFVGTEYGYTMKIDHGNGYHTFYGHLTANSNTVNIGDPVVAGRQIALSGDTGVGPCHLHLGVYHNNEPTDPFGWRGSRTDPLNDAPVGETAVCLWVDGQCSEFVVEDESEWFGKSGGEWEWGCQGNSWTLRYAANQSTDQSVAARWRPDLPHQGPYAVLAFIPATHATTTSAEYSIHDRDGDHTITVNQDEHSDEWGNLGAYDFWDGIHGEVYLENATGEATGSTEVCFDAVKFRQFRTYLPLVVKNHGAGDVVYVSSSTSGSVGGVSFEDDDILAYNTTTGAWTMYFDGSDVDMSGADINAFTLLSDGSILLSPKWSLSVPGLGTVDDSDIVKFIPTSTGDNTAGTFEWFLDGSDVDLLASVEDIDAISFTPEGKLVISTLGGFFVGDFSGQDEDLIVFTATQFGSATSGTWAMYFDGSDVDLNYYSSEDVYGVWIESTTGDIYLTTAGSFSVSGSSGDGADIFICHPNSLGDNTSCTFGPGLYWDGSANGFAGEVADGIHISLWIP